MEVLPQLFHTKFSSGLHEETLFIGNAQETPSTLGANVQSGWTGAAWMLLLSDNQLPYHCLAAFPWQLLRPLATPLSGVPANAQALHIC